MAYDEDMETGELRFKWQVAGTRRYVTVGVPGGEWQLTPAGDVYILCPVGSCRGVEISPSGGMGLVLAVADELVGRAAGS
jgi:hypothetical protein